MEAILANIQAFTGGPKAQVNATTLVDKVDEKKGVKLALEVVCFSKDRPYQLHQLLSSLEFISDGVEIHISIVYITLLYQSQYEKLAQMHPSVTFIEEEGFDRCLRQTISSVNGTHIMFLVDDLLFLEGVNTRDILQVMDADDSILGVQLKLHPGILYSHAASKACFPPTLQSVHAGNATEQLLFLKYAWRNGAVDWQYPIDLCAGVYRLPDIQHILDSVPKDSIHNPNAFEVMANQHFSQSSLMLDKYTHCCCPSRRMTVVVTVNKVQETYEVPVYKSPDHTLKALNAYMDRSVIPMYDVVRYCQQNYISAHVGDVFLLESDLITKKEDVLVTVLIAVYNGEKYVQECIDSLVRSQNGMVYNILVVDDGSTDSTPGILSTLQSSVAANYSSWSIKVITLDSNMGLAHALDVGLNACTTPFVARLDVDDIMLPGRLQRQLEYLQANPHIYVVGTQVYWNKESSQTFIMDTLICMKTHPILVHYDMLFRCPLLHPSVMFVRATVIEVGGYSGQTSADGNNGLVENQKYVEDYVLWTKIAAKYPFSLTNLPIAGIQFRTHSKSKSAREKEPARVAALSTRCNFIRILLSTLATNPSILNSGDIEKCVAIWTYAASQLTSLQDLQQTLQCLHQLTTMLLEFYMKSLDREEARESVKACVLLMLENRAKTILNVAKEKWNSSELSVALQSTSFHYLFYDNADSLRKMLFNRLL